MNHKKQIQLENRFSEILSYTLQSIDEMTADNDDGTLKTNLTMYQLKSTLESCIAELTAIRSELEREG